MIYVIYWNHRHRYAMIHRETCGYLRMHGGVSMTAEPTGCYSQNLETLEEAERIAPRPGYGVSYCQGCKPLVVGSGGDAAQ